MIETVSESTMPTTAFAKGIRELAAKDRLKAARVREAITMATGVRRSQYFERQNGNVPLSPAEKKVVGQIFRRYRITDPWGL